MNERIQELMTQCETKYSTASEPTYDMEKFAELILRETLRVTGAPPSMAETAKKHFGVE